jgi:hypothetical protein
MTKSGSNWLIGSFFIGQMVAFALTKTPIGRFLAIPLLRIRVDSVELMTEVAHAMIESNQYLPLRGSIGNGRWERVALVKKIEGQNSFLPVITFVPRGESRGDIVFSTACWIIVIFFVTMAFVIKGGLGLFMGLLCLAWAVGRFASAAIDARRVKKLLDGRRAGCACS